jgi:hypothetical protein
MDDNTTQEILSQLGSHQGCTAATLLHAFGTLRPLQLVQEHMTSPGEFIAAYSDNVNGRVGILRFTWFLKGLRRWLAPRNSEGHLHWWASTQKHS